MAYASDINTSPRVAIVVLTYRGEAKTRRCLESLHTLDGWPFATLVVDNASGTDEARHIVADLGEPFVSLTRRVNDGVAGGYNAGLRWASDIGATHTLLLNNDTIMTDPAFVTRMLDAFTETTAAVGPVVVDGDGSVWSYGGWIDWSRGESGHRTTPMAFEPYPVDWLDGSCLLVANDAARKIGGLALAYFMYWEDVDWGLRARAAGHDVRLQPATSLFHARGGRQVSRRFERLIQRNRILCFRRNASAAANRAIRGAILGSEVVPRIRQLRRPELWSSAVDPLLYRLYALAWNALDTVRRGRWALDADAPALEDVHIELDPANTHTPLAAARASETEIAFLVDDVLGWFQSAKTAAGIQHAALELVKTAARREDVRAWPARLTRPDAGGDLGAVERLDSRALDLMTIGTLDTSSSKASGVVRVAFARRAAQRLPVPPRLKPAIKTVLSRVRSSSRSGSSYSLIRPDILVLPGAFWWGYLPGAALAFAQTLVPIRTVVYDLFPLTNPEWFEPRTPALFGAEADRLLPFADRVVVLSELTANQVADRYPSLEGRIRLAPPTLAAFAARHDVPAARPAGAPHGPFALVLGTVEPRKNVAVVLEAWCQVVTGSHHPEASLVVAGRRGWMSEDVEAAIAAAASQRVIRIEAPSDAEVEWLYEQCALTIHASWAEGLGLPPRESIARGIPTLMSKGIPSDGLQHDQFDEFDPGDAGELALLIERTLARGYHRSDILSLEGSGWEPVVSALVDR